MSSKQRKTVGRAARRKPSKKVVPSVVWFEIPADDPERARKFYGKLFGWDIQPFPPVRDYWHVQTGGPEDTPDGGLMRRKHPQQPITSYINVASVTRSMARVAKLGGSVCVPKTPVPGMGFFAVCMDTENNVFALWERNERAGR